MISTHNLHFFVNIFGPLKIDVDSDSRIEVSDSKRFRGFRAISIPHDKAEGCHGWAAPGFIVDVKPRVVWECACGCGVGLPLTRRSTLCEPTLPGIFGNEESEHASCGHLLVVHLLSLLTHRSPLCEPTLPGIFAMKSQTTRRGPLDSGSSLIPTYS
ncbi:hypothetical protein J6590_101018 [Homalodisca vitripennis]|nr:hypothetical protein J6590_101018 [Homalodisca vitripennis]